jgi:hypothetical protein
MVQKDTPLNWLDMADDEILAIANPIMDNLMQASTDIDHKRHVRDFSEGLKEIVTKDNLEKQCKDYQKKLGFFDKRELVGTFKKESSTRVFWRQWYTKSDDEFVSFLHLIENNGNVEVVIVSVT